MSSPSTSHSRGRTNNPMPPPPPPPPEMYDEQQETPMASASASGTGGGVWYPSAASPRSHSRDISPTSSYHSAAAAGTDAASPAARNAVLEGEGGPRDDEYEYRRETPVTATATAHPRGSAASGSSAASQSPLLVTCHPPDRPPSFVFACLGVGGGPLENDCSCYMVKPAGRDWRQGSYVLEGGSWLGALSKLCDPADPSPAFSDFPFTHTSPSIRAGEVGSHAKAFLITHAHLDHILGMVLGSASLPGKRAVYGLRSTLDNLLGIFDGKLWPKLASLDENAPFIVYHCRPIECQKTIHLDDDLSVLPFALSHGLNMSTVPEPPTPAPQSANNNSPFPSASCYFSKRYSLPLNSLMAGVGAASAAGDATTPTMSPPGSSGLFTRTTFTSPFAPDRSAGGGNAQSSLLSMERSNSSSAASSPRMPQGEVGGEASAGMTTAGQDAAAHAAHAAHGLRSAPARVMKSSRRPKTASGSEKAVGGGGSGAATSTTATNGKALGAAAAGRPNKIDLAASPSSRDGGGCDSPPHHHTGSSSNSATMDSTAFFLTNKQTKQEVLFFGDVEPDCVSRTPRNRRVWQHAASRFARGRLNTVFLECSFPAAQPTEFLWGHLSTSHLYDELKVLARCVKSERAVLARQRGTAAAAAATATPTTKNFSRPILSEPLPVVPASPLDPTSADLRNVLRGLNVIVIHAKQAFFPSYAGEGEGGGEEEKGGKTSGEDATLSSPSSSRKGSRVLDPRTMQERILQELQEVEEESGLGVRFIMSKQGMRIEI